MAPKKIIADQLRERLSHIRKHPKEGDDDEQDEFNPPLSPEGATEYDKIVGTPARKDKSYAACFASATSTRVTTNPHDDFILRQSAHHEQLKQFFLLVSALGSKIESVAEVVAESSNKTSASSHSRLARLIRRREKLPRASFHSQERSTRRKTKPTGTTTTTTNTVSIVVTTSSPTTCTSVSLRKALTRLVSV
jgi:hypothetical protein